MNLEKCNARLLWGSLSGQPQEAFMSDFRALLADLRRPSLLIRAARFGLADYRRERDLCRLVDRQGSPQRTVSALMDQEEWLEQTRRRGDTAYSVSRHVEVLIALMAEARLLPRDAQPM